MLRRLPTASALATLLLLPAALLRADAPRGGKDLDGDWELVSMVRDGKEIPSGDAKPVLTIKGDAATFKKGDETHTGTIKLDPSKTPKTLDLTPADGPDQGKTLVGLYEIKGDELRVCHPNEPGKDRPKEFASKEGSGTTITTFKRVKK